MTRHNRGSLAIAAVMLACSSPRRAGGGAAAMPSVSTTDVHHFVAAYARLDTSDSTCRAFDAYFSQATPGLQAYARKFDVGRAELCAAVRRSPRRYDSLEAKLPALDSAGGAIRALFDRFAALDSGATLPGVYFVVGNGISGGTTTNGTHPEILIGMELNRSVAGVVGTIAHEFVHTQQHYPWFGSLTGGPTFLRGSLLRQAIKEGSADLIAELVTGRPRRDAYGDAHEAELWREFQTVMHGRDYSRWLYNGWNARALGDRPADLGYYVGYRITQAYYEKAADKRQAIRGILSIRDFDRFLAESGYAGEPVAAAR